jgi:hypothetical protein
MITFHVLSDGTVKGLYTEVFDLQEIGLLDVQRGMAIEFDNRDQVWRVFNPYGLSVHDSPSREDCLAWERDHLNSLLERS